MKENNHELLYNYLIHDNKIDNIYRNKREYVEHLSKFIISNDDNITDIKYCLKGVKPLKEFVIITFKDSKKSVICVNMCSRKTIYSEIIKELYGTGAYGKCRNYQFADEEEQDNIVHTGYEKVPFNKKYYFEDEFSNILTESQEDTPVDTDMYRNANYYSDKKAAENNARADRLMRQLRKFSIENRYCDEDWSYRHDYKIYIVYDYKDHELRTEANRDKIEFGQIYFDTDEVAETAMEIFEDELLWYFGEYQENL